MAELDTNSRWCRFLDFANAHVVGFLFIVALLTYMFTYLSGCLNLPIRADGEGYYAYLPSIFIHGDLSFRGLVQERFGTGDMNWVWLQWNPETQIYLNRYNVGVAILMLPSFLLAHLFTWLMQSPSGGMTWWQLHYPLDGYSLFYQHAAGLSGLFYGIMGIWLTKKSLRRYFSPGVVAVTLLAIWFGTNFYHYCAGESVLSHSYSFFLFALLLWLIPHWYQHPKSFLLTLSTGVVLGLISMVRLTNAITVVVLILFGVTSIDSARARLVFLLKNWQSCAVMFLAAVGAFLPQLLLWRYATGNWLAYSYGPYTFDFLHPHMLDVLFSLRAGMLFWSPLLVLALIGFWPMRKLVSDFWLAGVVFFVTQFYLVACWCQWWFGGGFGHRAFVEGYALLAFPLASLYAALKSKAWRWSIGILTVALVAHSLFLMKLYYTREISYFGLDWQAYYDILWLRKEMLFRIVGGAR